MAVTALDAVIGAVPRDDTIVRHPVNGDCWHMTWAADGRQLTAFCDGSGVSDSPKRYYNTRLYALAGPPTAPRFADIPGYPELVGDPDGEPDALTARYYGFGTLAVDDHIYQFLSTRKSDVNVRFVGAKLIYSPDNGATWLNQDGSAPVVWETLDERSKENMVFLDEPQEAFSILSVLQMGKGYEANADGYVYVYSPNGNAEGTMNQLVMFRVPKDRILEREAYEYFAGLDPDGGAAWTEDIDERAVVHAFPHGWVNTKFHPWAWVPSVTYNAPLGLYMMASFGMGSAPDGMWFGKPSYLGLWIAEHPWGPWRQIHEETAWTPGGDPGARAYKPQISPKWISDDGRSFWLVWTDFQPSVGRAEDAGDEIGRLKEQASSDEEFIEGFAALLPYYAFNAQRIDLSIAS